MIVRGVVKQVQDNPGTLQSLQAALGFDEVRDGLIRVQEYGLTSKPLPGAQMVTLFLDGNHDNGVVIAVDDQRFRLVLEDGEVSLYNDKASKVHLKKNGQIHVFSMLEKVVVEALTGIELKGVHGAPVFPIVTQPMMCAFTGAPHPQGSLTVKASP